MSCVSLSYMSDPRTPRMIDILFRCKNIISRQTARLLKEVHTAN